MSLVLRNNRIAILPAAIAALDDSLKVLDLADNAITAVPFQLSGCHKLKELKLDNNPLADRRLAKLITDSHFKIAAVFEHLKKNAPKDLEPAGKATKQKKKKKTKRDGGQLDDDEEEEMDAIFVTMPPPEKALKVLRTDAVETVRPHLACCIVRNVHLNSDGRFKKFLNVQNKMHDSENLCRHRTAAAIATHDLKKVKAPLTFTTRLPEELLITPLKSSVQVSAKELIATLIAEADIIRKKEKRNNYSGVYKYLNLVKDMTIYSCLLDADEKAISFAPVTNSDCTKMTAETTDLLLEVSSAESQSTCRRVLDRLLLEMLQLDLGAERVEGRRRCLHVEQVKVIAEGGELRLAYPDRLDLNFNEANIEVCREFAK